MTFCKQVFVVLGLQFVVGTDQLPSPEIYGTCSYTSKTKHGFRVYLGPTGYAGKKVDYSDAWANGYAVNYLEYIPEMKPKPCKVHWLQRNYKVR